MGREGESDGIGGGQGEKKRERPGRTRRAETRRGRGVGEKERGEERRGQEAEMGGKEEVRVDKSRVLGIGGRIQKPKTKSRNKSRGTPAKVEKVRAPGPQGLLCTQAEDEREGWRSSGLPGPSPAGFVGAFSETKARVEQEAAISQGGAAPTAPTFNVKLSLRCPAGASGPTSLL